ncbi:hypothetical protein [Hydrogenophaga sp. ANAO-22]|jgi:hypothetical protein|uniref:hypothetical protein n=1 Tax=Hydrogenophaga sp. ANAO-22 TaxID=3166645 RepID=UPI0036D22230
MYAEIQGGMTALKTALDLVKAGKGVIDQATMAAALYEIQKRLMETQGAALQAMEENTKLTRRVQELEAGMAVKEDWKAEVAKYERTKVAEGIVAFTEVGRSDRLNDAVKLCAHCFGEGFKSILQVQHEDMRQRSLNCPRCRSSLIFRQYADA